MKDAGKLEITTPSDREIAMTRTFDAPRPLVFEAFTRPELIKRWLGVRAGWTMPVCEVDLRVGGKYRYVWQEPKKNDIKIDGVFREIVAPKRIVATEKFDDSWYAGEAVDTTVFVEKGGRTTVTMTVRYESKAARDGVLATPMATGVAESYDKLAEYLATIA